MFKNVVVVCADDLSHGEMKHEGGTNGATPFIDSIADDCYTFDHHHAAISVCQPSRSVMMTGLYPFNNGSLGFFQQGDIKCAQTTLPVLLKQHGIKSTIMAKETHYAPRDRFQWDEIVTCQYNGKDSMLGDGKTLNLYKPYIEKAFKSDDRQLICINSHLPHRPFPSAKYGLPFNYPGSIPSIPAFVSDYSSYLCAVSLFDKLVEFVIATAYATNHDSDTAVIITSDNGMSFPLGKGNCYYHSSRVPFLLWALGIEPKHNYFDVVSNLDFFPTVCDLFGVPYDERDGKSLMPLFNGQNDPRRSVHTCYGFGADRKVYWSCGVHTNKFSYIQNPTYEGVVAGTDADFLDKAFKEARPNEYAWRHNRPQEEFYDIHSDPWSRRNLIDDSDYADRVEEYRKRMYEYKAKSNFPDLRILAVDV